MNCSAPPLPRPFDHRWAMPPLSRSGWQRLRRTLTAGVFTATTVACIGIGLQGATVSPVVSGGSTPTVTAAVPDPVPDTVLEGHRGTGPSR